MGSTALIACLMASPIVSCVLIIIKQLPAYEEDYEQRPPAQKVEQQPDENSPRSPNVIDIEDIRALAGIAEHPLSNGLKT